MQEVESKLFEWHRLYLELEREQAALAGRDRDDDEPARLARLRVARLHRDAEAAIAALHAAVARARSRREQRM